MSVALVIGAGGQDGSLLTDLLKSKGEEVWQIGNGWICDSQDKKNSFDLLNSFAVQEMILHARPKRIFYLAAFHHASAQKELLQDGNLWSRSHEVHVEGWRNILESSLKGVPEAALFYAASSLVFGNPEQGPQDEMTPLMPICVYGITKTTGIHLGRFYRSTKTLKVSIGFLYTHESSRRGSAFVAKKIINELLEVRAGRRDKLVLADLKAHVDWGFAPDYVDAMIKITALNEGGDFIIATGESHTVGEFAEIVCRHLNLVYDKCVLEKEGELIRKRRNLVGNPRKLIENTGWKRSVTFEEMVVRLTEEAASKIIKL